MTHADVLELIDKTNFGKWAILLYLGAAIAALIGVATNSPMRNYTWFFLGPALYSFLVGTTTQVQGVNWMVAGKPLSDMSDVWRIAETGLKNTRLASQGKIKIMGKNGPEGQYTVAFPMVFLDGLFSATTNGLVEFTGITNENGDGGANSNLAAKGGLGDGPWWLLSTLKWPMLENIVGATVRNPSLRDALVTFLSSECGDEFKKGINSGAYIAATQARGTQPIETVMIDGKPGVYDMFQKNLDDVSIPTPRALGAMFRDYKGAGSLGKFTPKLDNAAPLEAGRGQGIVCSEYLWTIIQGLRWEAGHSYHQLLRAAPAGFNEENFVRTLFYGWDIRPTEGGQYASRDQQAAFVKHLILAFMLRNELLYAPQVISYDQRFAPSEQSKSFGDAYVRTSGSKMKYTELYNAAVMMPYIQGIIAYLLIAAYPIATMLVILPGHYKGFFTWVAFFAWVKLWDVGFAMVQVIERSVWAMLGSGTNMAQSAHTLLTTAEKVGGIGVQGRNFVVKDAAKAALPIPQICSLAAGSVDASSCGSGADQTQANAWELFDKLLIVSANADLDLANGWYIYIMSALYLAVPAVTGQLVLGAKAGMAGMAKDAFQGVGNDAGGAARTGYQHAATNTAMTNQGSLAQAAAAKAMRKAGANGGGAGEIFGLKNQALDHGVAEKALGNLAGFHNARAGEVNRTAGLVDNAKNTMGNALPLLSETMPLKLGMPFAPFKNVGGGGGVGGNGNKNPGVGGKEGDNITPGTLPNVAAGSNEMSPVMKQAWAGANMKSLAAHQRAALAGTKAAGFAQDAHWRQANEGFQAAGKNQYANNLQEGLKFDTDSAVWEAKNAFASHVASSAGIAGMNAGSLSAGHKPSDMTGMAMNGVLNGYATGRKKDNTLEAVQYAGGGISQAAGYSGNGFLSHSEATMNHGLANHGSNQVQAAFDNQSLFSVGAGGQLDLLNPNVYGTVPNINGSTGNADLNNIMGMGLNKAVTAIENHSGIKLEGLKSTSAAKLDSIDNFPQPPKRDR
jgi:hypothetical protein